MLIHPVKECSKSFLRITLGKAYLLGLVACLVLGKVRGQLLTASVWVSKKFDIFD